MELTLLQIGKETVFPKVLKYPPNDFDVSLAGILSIDQDIVQVYNNKDIKFLGWDLIDITLEGSRRVRETKRYDLILKVAISSLKSRFLLVTFSDSHLMVCVGYIELGEVLGTV